MLELRQRLDELPAELYSAIYDLVFTVEAASLSVKPEYLPPTILQVSNATRRQMAQQYYGTSQFHFNDFPLCLRWLLSLEDEHLMMLREVRCRSLTCSWMLDLFDYEAKMQRAHVLLKLQKRGVELDQSVLHFTVTQKDGKGLDNWTCCL